MISILATLSPKMGRAADCALSAAPALKCDASVADLDVAKLKLEEKLRETSGLSFDCQLNSRQCIQGYEALLSINWVRSFSSPIRRIVVSEKNQPSKDGTTLEVGYNESPDELADLFGSSVEQALLRANDVLQRLAELNQPGALACRQGQDQPPLPCAQKDQFYDSLFSKPVFNVAIFRGYYDLAEHFHLPPQLKTLLGDDEKQFDEQIRELVEQAGFKIEDRSLGEVTLSREFYYKGTLKTARVRILKSLIGCPGEDPSKTVLRTSHVCSQQLERTKYVKAEFLKALGNDQLVIYAGHSRFGNGPDFGPAWLSDGKVPLRAVGLSKVVFHNPASILFVDSCDSAKYFSKAVQDERSHLARSHQHLGFASNQTLQHWLNFAPIQTRMIKGLIEGECPGRIARSMYEGENPDYHSVVLTDF